MSRSNVLQRVFTIVVVLLTLSIAAWATPVISSISPVSGLPFTQVKLSGSGFGGSAGTVTFNGAAATIVSWSDTVIVATAPSGSAGSGPVVVNRQSNSVNFSFIPTINSVSPQNVAIGQTIAIVGQNFGSTTGTVTLNGQQTQIVSWLATNIKFVVPGNVPTGANPVVVTNSVGSSPASTLNVQFAPVVSGISPSFGPPNTQVTITGTGFGHNTAGRVSFNGVSGTIVSWSDQQIVVNAPSGSGGSGPVVVSWQGVNSNSFAFNFLPTIFNLSPSTVGVGWNFAVVGQNFGASPGKVTLNGVPLTTSAWGTNSVHLAVTSSMCTGPIVITTAIGSSNSALLTVQGTTCGGTPPTITDSAAPSANASGWNNANVTVSFICTAGSSPIQSCTSPVTVSTETSGQVISGTATDTAGNTANTSVTVKLDKTPPVLIISSPTNGSTVTSSLLTITGNASDALSGVASITCNGTAATFQAGTYSCSVTLVPGNNAISVVATDIAGNTTTQSANVIYSAGPAISGFTPSSAPVGTLVTVSGSGFETNGSNPQITLNQQGGGAILAPISSATDTSLSFIIPSGAATGLLTVTSNGQSVSSTTPLTIVSDSSFSLAVGPSSATLLPGQTTAIQISLASTNGFSQLAALSVTGLPPGVTASFQPAQITAGQFSILTLSAPNTQSGSSSTLTITANATVQDF